MKAVARHFIFCALGWMWSFMPQTLPAQSVWDQRISCRYEAVALEEVFADLSNKHDIRFAYSPEFIPVKAPVTLDARQQPLRQVLTALFEPLPVRYQLLGKQAVLRYTPKPSGGQLDKRDLPFEVPQKSPLYTDPRLQQIKQERLQKWREELPPLRSAVEKSAAPLSSETAPPAEGDLERYRLRVPVSEPDFSTLFAENSRLAQISLLPYLGSNVAESSNVSNRLSFNLLWGYNGGVEGLELGLFVNSIRQDVQGIQIAGWANLVGDDVAGIQYAGILNLAGDTVSGVQLAGLANMAGYAYAVQGALGVNLAFSGLSGIQLGGLLNYCGGRNSGVQVSGLANWSRGRVKAQIGGLCNIAGDVEKAQVSSLLNIARHHGGSQFGLINIADSVAGVSIGLLNFIRRGYRSVEIGGGETFHGNFAFRLGVRRFYNIFYLGAQLGKESDPAAGNSVGNRWSWALGYGIGTSFSLGAKSSVQLEGISAHVNERAVWDSSLNQLQQFRLTYETRIVSGVNLYVGPAGYFLISKRKDPDTGLLQSAFAPYTWAVFQRKDHTQHQFWGGFTAGIRL